MEVEPGMLSDEAAHASQASVLNQGQPAVRAAAGARRAVDGKPVGGQLPSALRAHLRLLTGRVPTD